MPKAPLLLTGFEPFDGYAANPSARVAQALHGTEIMGRAVESRVLPVAFAHVPGLIEGLIAELAPAGVIACGQAAGETVIRLEHAALNLMHSSRPDNKGATPQMAPIASGGPGARFATLDVTPLCARLTAESIPARVSFHAGTHCCNLALYTILGATAAPAAFVHLPLLPEQVRAEPSPAASMSFDMMLRAVAIALEAAADAASLAAIGREVAAKAAKRA